MGAKRGGVGAGNTQVEKSGFTFFFLSLEMFAGRLAPDVFFKDSQPRGGHGTQGTLQSLLTPLSFMALHMGGLAPGLQDVA